MSQTRIPIATNILTTSAATVTFSSISGSYTDLILISNLIGSGVGFANMKFNGDTGANYAYIALVGNGSTTFTQQGGSQNELYNFGAYQTYSGSINSLHFFNNYSNTTTKKTVLGRYNAVINESTVTVGLWSSTSAINSITISLSANTFGIGSTFTLYGIKAE
jgi:hypothetical protein